MKEKQVRKVADEFKEQYIKLERIGAYIRKTDEKIKVYEGQLQKIRLEKQKKETSLMTQLGIQTKLNKTI